MNPPIVITKYMVTKLDDTIISVNVIRDDLLIGGTKQRAMIKFIEHYNNYNEFVYVGPASGFAQVALAVACLKLNKQATLFIVNSPNYDPQLSNLSEKFGANVTIFYEKMSDIEEKANQYVNDINKLNTQSSDRKVMLLPFGLNSQLYIDLLYDQLLEAIPGNIEPERLWITVGSGTLLRVLARIWPITNFMPVKVGKNLWEDQYTADVWQRIGGKERIDKLAAPQKFFEPVPKILLPPYPSTDTYDAKVWQQILKYAEDDDYIWNVASETETLKCIATENHTVLYNIISKDYIPKNINSRSEIEQDIIYNKAATEIIPLVRNGTIWFPFHKYFIQNPLRNY